MSEPRLDPEQIRYAAELQRMFEETKKFVAEAHKLEAEARKLDHDRWLAPALAIAAVIGGLLGVAAFIAKVLTS